MFYPVHKTKIHSDQKKILENFLIYFFSSYQKIHSLPKIDFTQKGFFPLNHDTRIFENT